MLSMALLSLVFTVHTASAWTQLLNPFSKTFMGTGYCGMDQDHPCLYWKEPHNTSINLYFYEDPSLWNGFDLRPGLTTASQTWNAAPAWNPYIYFCNPCSQGTSGLVAKSSTMPCSVPADTSTYYKYGTVEVGYNIPGGGKPWTQIYYTFITTTSTYFNQYIQWNWDGNIDAGWSCSNTYADGRNVATHESGHILGIGHTGDQTALMWFGTQSFYQLQSQDLQAVENIYPGNQPSS